MPYSVQWHRLPVSGPHASHVWVWHLSRQIHEANQSLPKGQWEEIDPTNLQTPFLALISQLADTWTALEHSSTLKTWARREDIAFVRNYPIILAFQTSGDKVFSPQLAPQIGELGLAAEGESLHLYSLESLGEEGKAACSQLQQALLESQREQADAILQEEPWLAAQEAARKLAQLYWQAHTSDSQLVLRRSTLPSFPFAEGSTFRVAVSLPVQAALAAYSNAQSGAGQWKENFQQLPTFTYVKEEGTTHVQMRPIGPLTTLDDQTVSALWHQVRQLSDLDGDVLLALIAQAIATPPDEKGNVWIKGTQILDYRGIKPKTHREQGGRKRRAGHRQEDLEDIADCIGHMVNTWLEVRQWIAETEAPDGKRRKKRGKQLFTQESRLINVIDTIYQYELRMPGESGMSRIDNAQPPLAIAWRYQLGSWSDPFLQSPNRQVAWLLQQVLSYDPYHETWEKRLARYFTFHLRMNAVGGGTTILRQVGPLIRELSLPVDYRNPEKTKQRLEKAMKRLVEDRQIDEWAYLEDLAQLPSRKWMDIWLTYNIQVHAAPLMTKLPPHEQQLLEHSARED
jgi:hypothetical protein